MKSQPAPPPFLFPFPTNTALWAENTSTKYAMDGDTTINSNDYKKIWTSQDAIFDINSATYYAALREQPEGVIKVVMSGTTNEEVLYNFNLFAGVQSATLFIPGHGYANVMITGYDSIQIEMETRPVYKVKTDQGYEYEWISGIGSKRGLFTPAVNFDPIEELYCFHQNDTLIYLHEGVADCNTTGVEAVKQEEVALFPNPTSGDLQISLNSTARNVSLILTDSKGSIIANRHLGSGKTFNFSQSDIAPGLYFYHLSNGDKPIQSGKLIFQ